MPRFKVNVTSAEAILESCMVQKSQDCCGIEQRICDNEVRKIVLSYLVHNCFKETAETFIGCSDMKRTADCAVDIDKRKRVFLASIYFLSLSYGFGLLVCFDF